MFNAQNNFDIANLFWIIFLTLVFSGVCLIVLLNIKKVFLKLKIKNKLFNNFSQFVFGLIFGLLSIYYFYVEQSSAVFFVFGLVVPIVLLFNFWFQIGTYITFFSSSLILFISKEFQLFIFFQIIFLFSIAFTQLLRASEKLTRTAKNILYIVVLTTIIFVYIQLFDSSFFNKATINIYSFVVLLFIFCLNMLYEYIENIFQKTVFLERKVEYDSGYFINANFAEKKILEFIKKNNVSYGCVCLFTLKKNISIEQRNFLRNENAINYWKKFVDQFDKNQTIFFKTYNNYFGFFLPMKKEDFDLQKIYDGNLNKKRDPDDPFQFMEQLTKKINNLEVTMIMDNKIKCKFNYYCSIYGIHSNNIQELITNTEVILNSKEDEEQNQIICFNPTEAYTTFDDFNKYDLLKKQIDLQKIKIIFTKKIIKDLNIFESKFFYKGKPFELLEKDLSKIVSSNLNEIFLKHLAALSLKKFALEQNFENNVVLIEYPLSSLYTNFDFVRFAKYIWHYKVPRERIYLTINIENQKDINEEIKKTIQNLQSKKIKIAFKNVGLDQYFLCEQLKPSLCFAKKIPINCSDINDEYHQNLNELYKNIKINIY